MLIELVAAVWKGKGGMCICDWGWPFRCGRCFGLNILWGLRFACQVLWMTFVEYAIGMQIYGHAYKGRIRMWKGYFKYLFVIDD